MTTTDLAAPPYTLERFVQLPALLPARVFMAWAGLTFRDLKEFDCRKPNGNGNRKFYKRDLAALCGFPYVDDECATFRLHQARRAANNLMVLYSRPGKVELRPLQTRIRELVELLG